jgi:hypothetical protein
VVNGSVGISAGGGLTIAPGQEIRFGPSDRLNVYGTLIAEGSPGSEIVFTRDATSNWYGLRFLTAGSGQLTHCRFDRATYAIDLRSSGSVVLDACTLQDNTYGVYATDGQVSFRNDVIVNNSSYGIWLAGATPTFGLSLAEWNDIYDNGDGQPGRNLRNGPTDINAYCVYWGTMDWQEIEDGIWDELDDEGLGRVRYVPYLNETHDGAITEVADPEAGERLPTRFAVHQNQPNPFNAATRIRFDLTEPARVHLRIYDIRGSLVATLIDGPMPAGYHDVPWHGTDQRGRSLASGVYLYRLDAGARTEIRRMMLVK